MAVTTRPREAVAPSDVRPPSTHDAQEDRGKAWSTDAAAEARHIGKRFDHDWVLRNLDLRANYGTIFGVFGPSGSGKTTTLRLLLGLVRPDEGEIRVLGTAPRAFRARTRARIGYMPQLFVLYPELSVSENLNLAASLYGMGWLRRRRPIRGVLEFVELWEHRGKPAGDLSGGMKRRLQLATALIHEPELIVVDEPTAGVDPVLRQKFWDRFRELRDQGRTIIVTSQYVVEAEYCDQLAILGRGQLVASGTPAGVRMQAFGGEIVKVVADGLDRPLVEKLAGLKGVRGIRVVSYEELQLTVREAGVAIPEVLSVLNENGAQVKQVQEDRPNFDEVFVRLMEQSDVASVE